MEKEKLIEENVKLSKQNADIQQSHIELYNDTKDIIRELKAENEHLKKENVIMNRALESASQSVLCGNCAAAKLCNMMRKHCSCKDVLIVQAKTELENENK